MRVVDPDLPPDIAVFHAGCIHKLDHPHEPDIRKDLAIAPSCELLQQTAEITGAYGKFPRKEVQAQFLVPNVFQHIFDDPHDQIAVPAAAFQLPSDKEFRNDIIHTAFQLIHCTAPF